MKREGAVVVRLPERPRRRRLSPEQLEAFAAAMLDLVLADLKKRPRKRKP